MSGNLQPDLIGGVERGCLNLSLSESSRLVKSESSDSLCSQSSCSSGTHPALRSLRQQPCRSQSTSSSISCTSAARGTRTGERPCVSAGFKGRNVLLMFNIVLEDGGQQQLTLFHSETKRKFYFQLVPTNVSLLSRFGEPLCS